MIIEFNERAVGGGDAEGGNTLDVSIVSERGKVQVLVVNAAKKEEVLMFVRRLANILGVEEPRLQMWRLQKIVREEWVRDDVEVQSDHVQQGGAADSLPRV